MLALPFLESTGSTSPRQALQKRSSPRTHNIINTLQKEILIDARVAILGIHRIDLPTAGFAQAELPLNLLVTFVSYEVDIPPQDSPTRNCFGIIYAHQGSRTDFNPSQGYAILSFSSLCNQSPFCDDSSMIPDGVYVLAFHHA